MKKVIEGMILASLLTTSLAAVADSGGDIVAARSDAATQRSMAHFREVVKARAALAEQYRIKAQHDNDHDHG